MKNQEPTRPIPAALLADANGYEQEIFENRIKRGFPTLFRTRTGVLIRISWSQASRVFVVTNAVTTALTSTAKVAFRLVAQLNEMPEQIEVAA